MQCSSVKCSHNSHHPGLWNFISSKVPWKSFCGCHHFSYDFILQEALLKIHIILFLNGWPLYPVTAQRRWWHLVKVGFKEVNVSKQLFFKGLVIVRYRNKKLISSSVTVQYIYILTLTRYRSLPPQKQHVSTAAFHAAATYSSHIINTVQWPLFHALLQGSLHLGLTLKPFGHKREGAGIQFRYICSKCTPMLKEDH